MKRLLFLLAIASAQAQTPTLQLDLGTGFQMDMILVQPGSFEQGSPATEAGATLTVADSPKRNFRIEVVKLDLAAAGPDGIPTKLSVDGVYLLGAHYPLNTAVDPVKLA